MSLPKPPVALDDICSVIYNNTLYTYSANAFQALPLVQGGNWTQLPQGEKVTGAACVGSDPADAQSAGFYVVGGVGANPDFQGFQKFTYATGKWESIALQGNAVTQQRQNHAAVYLQASDNILMYAGAQGDSQNPSTQTFTIKASAPYTVTSYESAAPPSIRPMLLPWSDREAILVGGSATNKIFLFRPDISWVDSGASLAEPLEKDVTAMKAALVTGDDQCRNLYTFDMTQSPNLVTRSVLINGQGQPVQNSPRITTRTEGKRDALTLGDWPQYNATLASKVTRSNFALAQDSNGRVVIAGGSDEDVLCIFDGRENTWENVTAVLGSQKVLADTTSTTSSPTTLATSTSTRLSTATSSTSVTPTAAAAPVSTQSSGSGLGTNTLLGIIFGSAFGAAVILCLIYLCIRRKRANQAYLEAGHMRRASGVSSQEKDSIVFANDSLGRGLAGNGVFRGHHQQQSGNSFSSMAILMGKVNQQNHEHPPGLKRNPSDQTKRSSSSSVFNKAFKSTISKPIPQMAEPMAPGPPRPGPVPDEKGLGSTPITAAGPRNLTSNAAGAGDKRDSTRRSSGWNRYWSGGSALNLLGFGNGNGNGNASSNAAAAQAKRVTVDTDRSSQYSDVSELSQHRRTQDSATVPPLNVYEPRASFSRVTRGSPTIAQYDKDIKEGVAGRIERPVSAVSDLSGYSSGVPASVHEAWDPTSAHRPWGSDRAPSSAYTSVYTPSAARQQNNPAPTGVSRQPQLAQAATSSDMSWLNLGDNGN